MRSVCRLAFHVHDLAQARRFYGGVLGCRESGSSEAAIDYEFFGHEISLCLGSVGGGLPTKAATHSLPVPRLSISMDLPRWRTLAQRLMAAGLQFQVPPHCHHAGHADEQWTMFFSDPSGNALEIKGLAALGNGRD